MTIREDSSHNPINYQKYLSLREAAQFYGYTRDHLGLMIRRGKLRGVRLGNYYATTNDWMNEYLKNYADSDNSKFKNKFSNKFRSVVPVKKSVAASIPTISSYPVRGSKLKKENTKPKTSGLMASLQADIDQVLLKALTKTAVKEAVAKPKIQTIQTAEFRASSLPSKTASDHEIIILPVRKMHDFERQIIISQAKKQYKD